MLKGYHPGAKFPLQADYTDVFLSFLKCIPACLLPDTPLKRSGQVRTQADKSHDALALVAMGFSIWT